MAAAGKILHKGHGGVQISVRHGIGYVGVHAPGLAAAQGQGLDLGDVAANHGEGQLFHQLHGGVGPQGGGTGSYGVQQQHMTQGRGLFPGPEHGLDAPLVQGADVDVQPAADGGDVLHVLRLVGHDGAAAAGQQDVGHVVDGDVIGDVVDQRHRAADAVQANTQHKNTLLTAKNADMPGKRHIRNALFVRCAGMSLRWHYPNQVEGSGR